MPRPDFTYDERHRKDQGANAPDCLIIIHLTCLSTDCASGDPTVIVIEQDSGEELARGKVTCTGDPQEHRLPMTRKRPLAMRKVLTRFLCGGEQVDGSPRNIWCVCA